MRRLVIVLPSLLLAIAPAAAQEDVVEAATEAAAVPAPDVPVARHEIARRIEESFHELQDVAPLLRRQPEYLRVRSSMPSFQRRLAALGEDPALERLDGLHPASLHDLEQEWSRVQARLTGWQGELETRAQELGEERERINAARRLWRLTLDVEREDPLNEAQRVRIEGLLEEMRRVKSRLETRSEEVLELQAQLSDEGLRIAGTIARIQSAQRNARQRRAQRDHRPLWEGWARDPTLPDPAAIGDVAAEHAASFSTFFTNEKSTLAAHAGMLALLAVALLVLRRRTRARTDARPPPSAQRAQRARPLAPARRLARTIAPALYPYLPAVVLGGILVAMVPAILRLGGHLLPGAHRPVLALVVLGALVAPLNLGFVPASFRPIGVLVIQLGAIAYAGWLSSQRWTPHIEASEPNRRALLRLVQLGAIPLVCALYFNVVGQCERAQLWTAGTLGAVELAVGLFFAAELLGALVQEALRHPVARRVSYTVRKRRRRVARLATQLARGGAVLLFLYVTLTNFDVLDPTLEATRLALRESFEFGEIQLSLGDLVAFLAMILGTIAVMQVVHSLLDLEILPRFALEQGISSAISLSVSYLLVAIGVVLAFGVAGVGPERLALLGGALGVGIGFGLQNVVSNFVSGLILVAERPIKVGDIIALGELVGTVRRIGIRSSTVASLDGAEVIVPNADLIAGRLVNWTLSDARRRLELVVGTDYDVPPERARDVLMQVVRTQPGVIHDPPPEVICIGFGESSVDFAIRAWTGGYLDAIDITSRLALRVHAALAKEGIEIPFPHRDVYLRNISPEAVRRILLHGKADE